MLFAYGSNPEYTIFPADMPTGMYDYIANLPQFSQIRLQEEVRNTFALVADKRTLSTNAYALVLADHNSPAFKETNDFDGVTYLKKTIESLVHAPVFDLTGMTNHYLCAFNYPRLLKKDPEEKRQQLIQELRDQLGLDLITTNMPIEMLIVEKVK
jgi:hypothetical protein